jgi:hypothetical protein
MRGNIVVLRKVQDIGVCGASMGDLKKLDPVARKMRVHVDGFYKAIEDNDSMSARGHIGEILKYAEYLNDDVDSVINKGRKTLGVNEIFAGGAPVRKYNQIEKVHPPSDSVLPGVIRTNRIGSIMRPQSNRSLQ